MAHFSQNSRRFQEEMNLFKEPHYKLNFIFLSLVGQWPYQNSRTRFLTVVFLSVLCVPFMEAQMMKLITSKHNVNVIVDILPFFFAALVVSTKYYTCSVKNETIKRILERIKHDWTLLKSNTERDILKKSAEVGMMYGLFYIIAIYIGVSVFVIAPFMPIILDIFVPLNTCRAHFHPVQVEYFLDEEKYFYSILIHMDIVVIISMTALIASDVLLITIATHACGTFDVLGYRLEHLFDDMDSKDDNVDVKYVSRIRIGECVKYHSSIHEYVQIVKSCYFVSSLIQLVLAVAILTSLLLRIFQNLIRQNYEEVLVSIGHATAHAFAVFMNVLPPQKLIDHSANIYYKTYFSRWYCAPVESQKLLLLILQKTKVPTSFTVAGILTSSLEMYATMLQTSVSYFTVFYSIK